MPPDPRVYATLGKTHLGPQSITIFTRSAELTVLPPESLGQVDFRLLSSQDLSGGDVWYGFETRYDGLVTWEASTDDAELTLFDQSFGRLQTSTLVGGRQRLDQSVSAGQTFYVRLGGLVMVFRTTPATLTKCTPLPAAATTKQLLWMPWWKTTTCRPLISPRWPRCFG